MDMNSIPTANLVNAVMDVLFKTQGVTPSRRDFEVLDAGWMGGVEGVLFFNGVAELKKRLDHMPISDLVIQEHRQRKEVVRPEVVNQPILSSGKDW